MKQENCTKQIFNIFTKMCCGKQVVQGQQGSGFPLDAVSDNELV
jgi:hypothetical protein